ncbi:NU205-like protein [Mya arenaria]|uniref:NU205-like protein n=1 Tax=Mya arenaria TaxID=6604 RepID=A0ABY7EIC0_MYAAR|nr:NU205-like protein [Mya arenaria]
MHLDGQVMQFIVSHGDIFHAILLDRRTSINLQVLQELALTTAVISSANCREEEPYTEVNTAEIEFRGHKLRIQRHMVALLPRYCVSEKLMKQLKNLDIQHEGDKAEIQAQVTQAYLDVATNVTSYCRALVSNSDLSVSSLTPAQLPNLGVLVYQLKTCMSQFLAVYEKRKFHLSKLEGLSDLSVEDLKQFSGVVEGEKMSSQQRQAVAYKRLSHIIAYNYRQLQAYSCIL